MTADSIIEQLQLIPHPEGGYYKRTYTANNQAFSAILYLMLQDNFSAFHKINADEQWNWYLGDAISIHEIDARGSYKKTILSNNNMQFQHVVSAGNWFAAECMGEHGFALCGCTVVPEFQFDFFELANRQQLSEQFPQHTEIIQKLTR